MVSLQYTLILLFTSLSAWSQTTPPTAPVAPTAPTVTSPTVTTPISPSTTVTAPVNDPATAAAQSIQVQAPVAPVVTPPASPSLPVSPQTAPPAATPISQNKNDVSAKSLNEKDTSCKKRWVPSPEISAAVNLKVKSEKELDLEKKRVELLKDKIRKTPTNLKLVVRLAKEFYDQGDFEKTSLLLWKQIDRLDLNDMALLAKAHERSRQFTDMRKVAELMIGKNNKFAEAYSLLAQTYDTKNSKERELAKNSYIKALDLDAKNVDAVLRLVDIYYSEANLYEVRNLLNDMLKKNPNEARLTAALCEVSSLDSLHDDTRKICPAAIRLMPESVDNYVYNGISYKETEDWEEAENLFRKAAIQFPTSEFALVCLAETQQHKKDNIGAYKSLKAAHQAEPSSDRALLAYSRSAFDIKKLDEALEGFSILCARNKNYAVELRRSVQELRKSFKSDETARFEAALRRCGFY